MEDDFNDRRDAFVRLLEKYGAEVKEIAQVCQRSQVIVITYLIVVLLIYFQSEH